jgi:hypothetical protein
MIAARRGLSRNAELANSIIMSTSYMLNKTEAAGITRTEYKKLAESYNIRKLSDGGNALYRYETRKPVTPDMSTLWERIVGDRGKNGLARDSRNLTRSLHRAGYDREVVLLTWGLWVILDSIDIPVTAEVFSRFGGQRVITLLDKGMGLEAIHNLLSEDIDADIIDSMFTLDL